MILGSDLQFIYTELYSALRKYILDLKTVEALADLEVETYKLFPNPSKLSEYITKLKYCIYDIISDKEVDGFINEFIEVLTSDTDLYANLVTFTEVVNENQEV